MTKPELYWISGSPPSWRVMLALGLKGVDYISHRLDSVKGEHKTPRYLALNPRGQVPTLCVGDLAVRESIAILAFLDIRWPKPSIFGSNPVEAAAIWQAVMEIESNLRPAATTVAQVLFRGQAATRRSELLAAAETASAEFDRLDKVLAQTGFVAGDAPSAADCVLYPTISWVRRALTKTEPDVARGMGALEADRPSLGAWMKRIEALPYFASTYPPHWRDR